MDLHIKFKHTLLTFLVVIGEILTSEVPRPRGVSLSRASLYNPDDIFVCLDGKKSIPFSQVNDDYCDCLDASDEPGTSACPHGTFHCTNAGHKPLNIESSRVNDGICDCCDGSDEYANNHISCPNNCLVLGQYAREEAQKKAELFKVGKQLLNDLSKKGVQLKQEKNEKLTELQRHKEEAENVKNEKQKLKDDIEILEKEALEYYRKLEEEEKAKKAEEEKLKTRNEAREIFLKFDLNQDGQIEITELQTRQTFDKDKNGEVSIEEAIYFLNNEESVDLEKFITDSWPNIKPYLMMDAGLFKPPVTAEDQHKDTENLEHVEEEADDQETEAGDENVEDDDDDEGEDDEEEPPQPEIEQIEDHSLKYDDETQKLVDQATAARNEFSEAERNVRDIENEIKNIEDYLQKDFGPDEEFATLEGQCFDYIDHEYIYRLCPFDKIVQQPKSSSSETRLGTWGRWAGPDDNKYNLMIYERGQSCWNGPQRATHVSIACGTENKVLSVTEPNRCEYNFEFITPAACRDFNSDKDDIHDEL